MDGAGAAEPARFRGRLVDVERPTRFVGVGIGGSETDGISQELVACSSAPFESSDAGKALESDLFRDLGMARHEWMVGCRLCDQLEAEAFGVFEAERLITALGLESGAGQALRPEVERALGGDAKPDSVDHPRARPSADQAG